MVSNFPSVVWKSVNEDTMNSILSSSSASTSNYVFFIPSSDIYSLRDGVLYSGDESLFNILG